MLLSDRDIRTEIAAGRLRLDPYEPALLQPSSVDVRLDRWFRVFNNQQYTHIDPALQQDDLTTLVEPKGDDPFVLHPGEFVLGSTLEIVTLPDDLAGRLEGKSSLGRLGLLTHSTAGFIDPGFNGHITLELSNVATLPIILHPGMKIGQLCLFRLSSPSEQPYGRPSTGPATRASAVRPRPGPGSASAPGRPVTCRAVRTPEHRHRRRSQRPPVRRKRVTSCAPRARPPRRPPWPDRQPGRPVGPAEHPTAGHPDAAGAVLGDLRASIVTTYGPPRRAGALPAEVSSGRPAAGPGSPHPRLGSTSASIRLLSPVVEISGQGAERGEQAPARRTCPG